MTRRENAEEIFNKAVELSDPAEQAKYLDEACGGDEKLRTQVEALLKWHAEAGSFLEVPAVDPNVTLDTSASGEGPGAVIGRYKLLEKVGEGGMATVYMAEQKHPIRRRVALKVIKLGMDTKQVIARFEAERQALAMMDHPNIAKVLDAGTTDTGRPYFVMELVRGLPITEFCDRNHLSTQERLQLFITVCQAVQHAHQRGIIHRDIKPSNILVTLHDGEPVAKVIDFGIAKAVNQQLTEKTVFTRYSQMIGTPEYMSPEQAEMSGLDIDTRTDVFSLGVLLYELLTGTTPFDSEYLLSKGYGEMQRIIREEEPIRPSTKVSTMGQTLTEVATHRRTSPELLCKLIRTDLDWIVMKTLEKDRSRRYESVSELAADVKRHLDNEPVLAGRPSTVYRVQKFVRRNRLLVASASVITTVLVVATTVSLWQMVRANWAAHQLGIERDRAVKAELVARTAEEAAGLDRDRAEASEEDARLNLYAADMIAAQKYLSDGNLGAIRTLLQAYSGSTPDKDLRGWEWRYLWTKTQGDQQRAFRGHDNTVTAVAFSPDGELLASGSIDQSVIVWDRAGADRVRLKTEGELNSVSFSSDGKYLAAGHANGVSVWDAKSFMFLKTIRDHEGETAFAVFSPSSSMLAIGYGNGLVRVCDCGTDDEGVWLGRTHDSYPEEEYRLFLTDAGCPLAFSGDGSRLIKRAAGSGLYEVWDVGAGRCIASLRNPEGAYLHRWGNATFVPGKHAVFVARLNGPSLLWDYENDTTMVPISGIVGHRIVQGIFLPGGMLMMTAGFDHTVRIWEASEGGFQERACFWGHGSEVRSIAISPDGTQIATGGQDRQVLLWNSDSQSVAVSISKPSMEQHAPCFSPDGRFLAIPYRGARDHKTAFYDLNASHFLKTEADGYPWVFAEQRGDIFISRFVEGEWAIFWTRWDMIDSRALLEKKMPLPRTEVCGFAAICRHRGVLAQGWKDGSVGIIDYQIGELRQEFKAHQSPIETTAFSPKGDLLLTSGGEIDNPDANAVVVWSCSDLTSIKPRYRIQGHMKSVHAAAFSPGGDIVATGGADSKILLSNASNGACRRELIGHKRIVYRLAFAPDGKTLASASHDGTVRLWHVATGRELATLTAGPCALTVAFSPDGNTLAAVTGADPYNPDEMKIWRVPSLEDIENPRGSASLVPSLPPDMNGH